MATLPPGAVLLLDQLEALGDRPEARTVVEAELERVGRPRGPRAAFVALAVTTDAAAEELPLASRLDALVAGRVANGYRVRLSPEAAELLVERALRLGGGAWGLKAVLAATLSGVEASPDAGTADEAPPIVN